MHPYNDSSARPICSMRLSVRLSIPPLVHSLSRSTHQPNSVTAVPFDRPTQPNYTAGAARYLQLTRLLPKPLCQLMTACYRNEMAVPNPVTSHHIRPYRHSTPYVSVSLKRLTNVAYLQFWLGIQTAEQPKFILPILSPGHLGPSL